ncbi:MAG: DNA-binding protein [Oscillospiraceae bacterium]|nr:DNA-binding protein [Oscillospiraceae bacterium]
MDYKRFDNTVIARLDKGEEILEQLEVISRQENIKLASISALGATNDITVGVFRTGEKKYYANHFTGDMEIVSLTGTVSTMDGKYYAHLHMSAGDEKGHVFGGHLNRAVISATCEMVIRIIDGQVDRELNEAIGLNTFRF